MCPDPTCAFGSYHLLIAFLRKFHQRTEEWPEYEKSLKSTSILLSDLDSGRKHLSRSNLTSGGWEAADRDIRAAESLLKKAKKLIDWDDKTSSRTGRKTKRVEFALKYTAAIEHRELLSQHREVLQQIRERVDLEETNLQEWELYLRKTRGETSTALARQHMRHVISRTGMGQHTPPQPVLSEPHPVEKASTPHSFPGWILP